MILESKSTSAVAQTRTSSNRLLPSLALDGSVLLLPSPSPLKILWVSRENQEEQNPPDKHCHAAKVGSQRHGNLWAFERRLCTLSVFHIILKFDWHHALLQQQFQQHHMHWTHTCSHNSHINTYTVYTTYTTYSLKIANPQILCSQYLLNTCIIIMIIMFTHNLC